jgi:hypothetical protein
MQGVAGGTARAAAAGDAAGEAPDSPQQDDARRDAVVIIADQEPSTKHNSRQYAAAGFAAGKLPAPAGDAVVLELPSFAVRSKGPSSTLESSSSGTGITSSITSASSAAGPAVVTASSPRIHACIVLDPIYSGGRVIGYTAERSFLHPQGVKGAVKLLQRHAVELLQAEGLARLNLGLAVGYEVKPGAHGAALHSDLPETAFTVSCLCLGLTGAQAIFSAYLSSGFSKLLAGLVHVYAPGSATATGLLSFKISSIYTLVNNAFSPPRTVLQGPTTASRTAPGSPPRCSCATSTPTASTPSATWRTPRPGEHSNAASRGWRAAHQLHDLQRWLVTCCPLPAVCS